MPRAPRPGESRDGSHGDDQGRGAPLSNGLMWSGHTARDRLRIEDSGYFAPCDPDNIVWPRASFEIIDRQARSRHDRFDDHDVVDEHAVGRDREVVALPEDDLEVGGEAHAVGQGELSHVHDDVGPLLGAVVV